jgi:ABC-type lipoprotein release transport system permease subunit
MFRAEARRRWPAWLAIAILISVVGGFVLAAAAAGRRTEAAFPRFVSAHGFDTAAYTLKPVPGIARLPGVSSATEMIDPSEGQPTCDCIHPIDVTDLTVGVVPPTARPIWKLVAGHLPDPSAPDQVLASFSLESSGVHVGSVIRVPFYAPAQLGEVFSATGKPPVPRGPTIAFHVVGIEASESEFPSGSVPAYDLFATQAFGRTVAPRTAVAYQYLIRLHNGTAGLPQLDAQLDAMRRAGVLGYQNANTQADAVESSIHPQAVGWWILAALAALVGLAVIGQALARQSVVESQDYPTLTAIGAGPRQLVALGTARTLAVAVTGAAGALALATLLSPLAPVGEARLAEDSTGVAFDTTVLLTGAAAVVVAVLALGVWPSLRAARNLRPGDRAAVPAPSAVATRLAATGAPPSALIGVRHALQRRSSGAAVPVGTALLGTVLAVTALTGTAVFGASLTHLLATPALYGVPFQLNFSDTSQPGGLDVLRTLKRDKDVTRISRGIVVESSVNNVNAAGVAVSAIRGPLLFSTVAGTLPTGDGQIGMGSTTMRQTGAHLGSVVRVTVSRPAGGKRTVPFRVVSQISFPVISGAVELGNGVLFTAAGYENAVCPPGPGQVRCRHAVLDTGNGGILASVVPGPRGRAAVARYVDADQTIATLPSAPSSLINFGEAVNFPLIFGAVLAVFGAATLAHLLVVSVARRRRETGLLKVLGFVKRQVASTVAWQATTLAIAGIAVGVPLGLAAGQALWRAFASNLGVIPVAVVPPGLIAVLIAGIIVAANLIAAGPGLAATRSKPAQLLRAQ